MAQADPNKVLQRIVSENARLNLELIAADETVKAYIEEVEQLKAQIAEMTATNKVTWIDTD